MGKQRRSSLALGANFLRKDIPTYLLIGARYCYGAPYVCDELSQSGICTAGAFGHPAFLKESHFFNLTSESLLPHSERSGADQNF